MESNITEQKWRLPVGVEALLPDQAMQVERMRRSVIDLFHTWGYQLVSPAIIDHLGALKVGAGQDLVNQIFGLTDPLTGELLGIRADIAPQVARIDAHSLQSTHVNRLCYCDTVLQARPKRLSDQRVLLQTGAELYGHDGVDSDFEVIQLLLSALDTLGIEGFHLDVGHVGVLNGILGHHPESAHLPQGQHRRLRSILQRKSLPDLLEFMQAQGWSDSILGEQLKLLISFHGQADQLSTFCDQLTHIHPLPNHLMTILDELKALFARLSLIMDPSHLIFDLAESRGFHYHTGVVFAVYVPTLGRALATGGRYNGVGQAFGQARAATGFSLDILKAAHVLAQVPPMQLAPSATIYAPYRPNAACHQKIQALRKAGESVIVALSASEQPEMLGCNHRLVEDGSGNWLVELI